MKKRLEPRVTKSTPRELQTTCFKTVCKYSPKEENLISANTTVRDNTKVSVITFVNEDLPDPISSKQNRSSHLYIFPPCVDYNLVNTCPTLLSQPPTQHVPKIWLKSWNIMVFFNILKRCHTRLS